MRRGGLFLLLLAGLIGCGGEEPALRGIATRVAVDRTEASVGDMVGVTVEVRTPPGLVVREPAHPPESAGFLSERLELRDPEPVPGGLRHVVLWTLRARAVGEHALPDLPVPLVRPDGRVDTLRVGGAPLPVRSVRADLPEQETWFDIRAAPDPPAGWAPVWIAAGVATVLAAAGAVVLAQRRAAPGAAGPDVAALRSAAVRSLEAALAEPDPRRLARRLRDAIDTYLEGTLCVPLGSRVPAELPPDAEPELVRALAALDAARFAREARREAVLEAARDARTLLGSDGPRTA